MNEHGKIQTVPTTMVTGYWDPGSVSDVPENIKIVMANGTRAEYRLNIVQPKPNTLTPSKMAELFTEHVYGGYKCKK